jgi:Tfp pilus assembly protein PilF/peroxiredoxin
MKCGELSLRDLRNCLSPRAVLVALLVASAAVPSLAVSQLKQYDKAPAFDLPAMLPPGKRVSSQPLDRPILLMFGEAYNERTQEALAALKKIYKTAGLTEIDLPVYLIMSQEPTEEQKAQLDAKDKVRADILLDKDRKAFGDYGVIVLPSVVIIDRQGRINLALSGFPLTFSDIVEDAILFTVGRMTREEYESSVATSRGPANSEDPAAKVGRLTGLAGQLMRRGFAELALERYREVLTLDANYVPARLGMAQIYIRLNRLPEATEQLQNVLKADENNIEANLLMAWVEIRRGGEEIASAKWRLNWLLTTHPSHPQANYLMGAVCEAQGEKDRALEHYKKAAQVLLEMDQQ